MRHMCRLNKLKKREETKTVISENLLRKGFFLQLLILKGILIFNLLFHPVT